MTLKPQGPLPFSTPETNPPGAEGQLFCPGGFSEAPGEEASLSGLRNPQAREDAQALRKTGDPHLTGAQEPCFYYHFSSQAGRACLEYARTPSGEGRALRRPRSAAYCAPALRW